MAARPGRNGQAAGRHRQAFYPSKRGAVSSSSALARGDRRGFGSTPLGEDGAGQRDEIGAGRAPPPRPRRSPTGHARCRGSRSSPPTIRRATGCADAARACCHSRSGRRTCNRAAFRRSQGVLAGPWPRRRRSAGGADGLRPRRARRGGHRGGRRRRRRGRRSASLRQALRRRRLPEPPAPRPRPAPERPAPARHIAARSRRRRRRRRAPRRAAP